MAISLRKGYNITEMHDLYLIIIVVGFVLGYVSVLLFINLTSQGVASGRIYRLLIEIWVTFALIIAVLAFITSWLGPVPAGGINEGPGRRIIDEFATRSKHWSEITGLQQGLIIAGVVIALALFAHIFWSLGGIKKYARVRNTTVDGGKE